MSTPTTKKRTVTDAGLPDDDADVPCCWLCLEEGPDESGKPLVRDCSCRGTSSFAHLSCIVGWAENEGKRMKENEERLVGANVMRAFIDCPNCKQSYQNDLMRNLASAAVDFVEEEFGGIENGELRVSALSTKLVTLDAKNREYIVKGGELCSKLLALTDEMKILMSSNAIGKAGFCRWKQMHTRVWRPFISESELLKKIRVLSPTSM